MATTVPLSPPPAQGPYRVSAPRRDDALAGALRAVFREQLSVPDDLQQLLERLSHLPER